MNDDELLSLSHKQLVKCDRTTIRRAIDLGYDYARYDCFCPTKCKDMSKCISSFNFIETGLSSYYRHYKTAAGIIEKIEFYAGLANNNIIFDFGDVFEERQAKYDERTGRLIVQVTFLDNDSYDVICYCFNNGFLDLQCEMGLYIKETSEAILRRFCQYEKCNNVYRYRSRYSYYRPKKCSSDRLCTTCQQIIKYRPIVAFFHEYERKHRSLFEIILETINLEKEALFAPYYY